MCSILLILSFYIVVFTLISDFNRFCTVSFDLEIAVGYHGYADKKASRKESPCACTTGLVLAQKRVQDLLVTKAEQYSPSVAATPFKGPLFPRQDLRSDEPGNPTTMEMPPMQESLQWKTRPLCEMWPVLEGHHGHPVCAPCSQCWSEKGAMGVQPLARFSGM